MDGVAVRVLDCLLDFYDCLFVLHLTDTSLRRNLSIDLFKCDIILCILRWNGLIVLFELNNTIVLNIKRKDLWSHLFSSNFKVYISVIMQNTFTPMIHIIYWDYLLHLINWTTVIVELQCIFQIGTSHFENSSFTDETLDLPNHILSIASLSLVSLNGGLCLCLLNYWDAVDFEVKLNLWFFDIPSVDTIAAGVRRRWISSYHLIGLANFVDVEVRGHGQG